MVIELCGGLGRDGMELDLLSKTALCSPFG
jgi:hypothetical protein